MRDQDGIEALDVLANHGETPDDFAAAQPGVDQQTRPARCYKDRVTGTAACEYANLDDAHPPTSGETQPRRIGARLFPLFIAEAETEIEEIVRTPAP